MREACGPHKRKQKAMNTRKEVEKAKWKDQPKGDKLLLVSWYKIVVNSVRRVRQERISERKKQH